jgi:hypothetical protein
MTRAPSAPGARVQGSSPGNPIEPVRKELAPSDGARFLTEHQKGRLEAVLGILPVGHQALTDTPDHRPVSPQESREGHAILMQGKLFQEFLVSGLGARVSAQGATESVE